MRETLFHIVLECPIYEYLNGCFLRRYLAGPAPLTEENYHEPLVNNFDIFDLINVYYFMDGVMKTRCFILNE